MDPVGQVFASAHLSPAEKFELVPSSADPEDSHAASYGRAHIDIISQGKHADWTLKSYGLEDDQILDTFNCSLELVSQPLILERHTLQLVIMDHNDQESSLPARTVRSTKEETIRQTHLQNVHMKILALLQVAENPGKDAITYAKLPPRLSRKTTNLLSLKKFHLYRITAGNFDLIWAYGHDSRAICGILNHSGPQAGLICRAVRDDLFAHRSLAKHPMLLGLLAHFHIAPHIEGWLGIHARGILKAAGESGFHYNLAILEGDPVIDSELGELSAEVSGHAANIATNRHCWDGLYRLANFIIRECEQLGELPVNANQDQWLAANKYIIQHARCCAERALSLREEADSWQKKASIQIQGFFSLIAQRDQNQSIGIAITSKVIAQDTKRDSTSMKALAVVTICFLPGIFVAVSVSLYKPIRFCLPNPTYL